MHFIIDNAINRVIDSCYIADISNISLSEFSYWYPEIPATNTN
jgi:hypothetical protein